jgi:hypothetical protein
MNWKSAVVDWLTLEDGGRKVPPTGEEPPVYWAVVKLVGEQIEPQPNSWSLSVRMMESENNGYRWKGLVQFRVPEAPQHLLVDGVNFELFEGPKKVAVGRICE